MKRFLLLLSSILIFHITAFCQIMGKNKNTVSSTDFINSIKKAHHFDLFHQQKAIAFDIEMTINGKSSLNATITTLTSSGKIRLNNANGKTVIFDGKKTYLSPANADYPKARFDIFTYQYFFMAPFKVADKGTQWEMLSDKIYNYNDFARARLTFQNGTGDSSNDWYIVHRNKATSYLEALAYIVTYGGKPVAEAEKKVSSIYYSDWKAVGGVMFATTWKFMNWSEEKGFFGTKAEVKIKNIRFITPDNNTFAVPVNSKEVGF